MPCARPICSPTSRNRRGDHMVAMHPIPADARLILKPIWFVPTPIGLADGAAARMGNGLIWFQGYELSAFSGAQRIARKTIPVADFDTAVASLPEPLAARATASSAARARRAPAASAARTRPARTPTRARRASSAPPGPGARWGRRPAWRIATRCASARPGATAMAPRARPARARRSPGTARSART